MHSLHILCQTMCPHTYIYTLVCSGMGKFTHLSIFIYTEMKMIIHISIYYLNLRCGWSWISTSSIFGAFSNTCSLIISLCFCGAHFFTHLPNHVKQVTCYFLVLQMFTHIFKSIYIYINICTHALIYISYFTSNVIFSQFPC